VIADRSLRRPKRLAVLLLLLLLLLTPWRQNAVLCCCCRCSWSSSHCPRPHSDRDRVF